MNGVFSSITEILASSLIIQFQNNKKKESKKVVIGFMRDHIYWTMNFATLKYSK